ncbi:RNA polymerase sigma-70 factor [Agriterribacter sp.]|uniref:RNA polymerase sigma factor n=1 Tax=Agriterribacter sp. TaxID=2821509 RepID=UPI002BE66283|nr:RNA polymerase sigma-70 factor [Agriterribacter sp.]HRP55173.1 RNA polymerase sigma-70 factor [Agriterribacter sp.]
MYNQLTDDVLIQMLRNSDAKAFEEIYRRHWERLALQVLKITRSREDARDIVQEVFVSIWRRRMEIELKGELIGYLLKSVRNTAIRHIEKNITRNNYLQTLSGSITADENSPGVYCEYRELDQRVAQAVASLPPKMQTVYLLSRNEKMSYKEIADRLGIAENTVKKQLSNALKSLRTSVTKLTISLLTCLATMLQVCGL